LVKIGDNCRRGQERTRSRQRLECVELAPAFRAAKAVRKRQQAGRSPNASRVIASPDVPIFNGADCVASIYRRFSHIRRERASALLALLAVLAVLAIFLAPGWRPGVLRSKGGRDKGGSYRERAAQKSSKRPDIIQQRRAIMALAARPDQCMPDCLRRQPMTVNRRECPPRCGALGSPLFPEAGQAPPHLLDTGDQHHALLGSPGEPCAIRAERRHPGERGPVRGERSSIRAFAI